MIGSCPTQKLICSYEHAAFSHTVSSWIIWRKLPSRFIHKASLGLTSGLFPALCCFAAWGWLLTQQMMNVYFAWKEDVSANVIHNNIDTPFKTKVQNISLYYVNVSLQPKTLAVPSFRQSVCKKSLWHTGLLVFLILLI